MDLNIHLKLINFILSALAPALLALSLNGAAYAGEPTVDDNSRGKLLYSLHCATCHNEQKHWRVNKKASDWPSLVSQVKLWQNVSNLKWDKTDIENVAAYLNTLYYHYPMPDTMALKK